MTWIIAFVLLLILELAYFRAAVYWSIVDKPNARSSHSYLTIRGGGVVFLLGFVAWQIQAGFSHPLSLLALVLIGAVSFWDDIRSLPNSLRLGTQLLGTILVFYELQLFDNFGIGYLLVFLVLIIGTINAYNFMDGINGITGLYSLLAMVSMSWLNQKLSFIDGDFFIWTVTALVVFLIFNFRKQAKCFAGDVGSIGIAFLIIFALIQLIQATGNLAYILFLAVYGVDSALTILHRLLRKENIFQAHRMHLYQLLVNQRGLPHRLVSIIYMVVQLLINLAILLLIPDDWSYWLVFVVVLLPLVIGYLALKYQLIKRYSI